MIKNRFHNANVGSLVEFNLESVTLTGLSDIWATAENYPYDGLVYLDLSPSDPSNVAEVIDASSFRVRIGGNVSGRHTFLLSIWLINVETSLPEFRVENEVIYLYATSPVMYAGNPCRIDIGSWTGQRIMISLADESNIDSYYLELVKTPNNDGWTQFDLSQHFFDKLTNKRNKPYVMAIPDVSVQSDIELFIDYLVSIYEFNPSSNTFEGRTDLTIKVKPGALPMDNYLSLPPNSLLYGSPWLCRQNANQVQKPLYYGRPDYSSAYGHWQFLADNGYDCSLNIELKGIFSDDDLVIPFPAEYLAVESICNAYAIIWMTDRRYNRARVTITANGLDNPIVLRDAYFEELPNDGLKHDTLIFRNRLAAIESVVIEGANQVSGSSEVTIFQSRKSYFGFESEKPFKKSIIKPSELKGSFSFSHRSNKVVEWLADELTVATDLFILDSDTNTLRGIVLTKREFDTVDEMGQRIKVEFIYSDTDSTINYL